MILVSARKGLASYIMTLDTDVYRTKTWTRPPKEFFIRAFNERSTFRQNSLLFDKHAKFCLHHSEGIMKIISTYLSAGSLHMYMSSTESTEFGGFYDSELVRKYLHSSWIGRRYLCLNLSDWNFMLIRFFYALQTFDFVAQLNFF